jgi:hypothetical protein
MIGQLGHLGFVIPWVYHFLSHLWTLLAQARNKRTIKIDKACMSNLELMLRVLDKAKGGIDMNLLAFCASDQIYYSDSCPAGLRGYSNQGFAQWYHIPNKLLFRGTNNLLEYLAAIITLWINLINGRLHKGDCALSMTDSLTAKGWMRKTNVIETGDDAIQAAMRVDTARHYACIFMDGNIKGQSQWFPGKENSIADALSQDWHHDDKELISILRHHFPSQMPKHFVVSQIPSKINSWLTSLLQQLPMREQLRELHMTTQLNPGGDGPNIACPLDATISIWTNLADKSKYSSSGLLAWLSGKEDP